MKVLTRSPWSPHSHQKRYVSPPIAARHFPLLVLSLVKLCASVLVPPFLCFVRKLIATFWRNTDLIPLPISYVLFSRLCPLELHVPYTPFDRNEVGYLTAAEFPDDSQLTSYILIDTKNSHNGASHRTSSYVYPTFIKSSAGTLAHHVKYSRIRREEEQSEGDEGR
jgi:hypothetical protein